MRFPEDAPELARVALHAAIDTAGPSPDPADVVEAARLYYAFLTNPVKTED